MRQKTVEENTLVAQEWTKLQACPRCGNAHWHAQWVKTPVSGWKLRCGECKQQALKEAKK